jgi:hypothetical protein
MAPTLADKVAARDYVAHLVGTKYVKEAYLICDEVEEIDFNRLPNSFVVKASHGSGFNLLVPDKKALDPEVARKRLARYLSSRFGFYTNEWWYSQIQPRLLVERFLPGDNFGRAANYDFFVFHGSVEFIRAGRVFYDSDWRPQEFFYPDLPRGHIMDRPPCFEEMKAVARTLAGGLDFLRVDLYCVDQHVLFGELTFAPGAGWVRIEPRSAADFIGSCW